MKAKDRLFWIFVVWKLFILLLAFLSAHFITPWNDSVQLLFDQQPSLLRKWLSPLASWDGAYFLDIAIRGYRWEQKHAFLPLLPLLMRLTGKALAPLMDFATGCLVGGVFWSMLGHAIAVQLLFKLSRLILADEHLAFMAAAFYCLNPASAYLTGIYSESIFAALCFGGMLCFHRQWRLSAALLFALAGLCRSNGILMGGFFIFEWLFGLRHALGLRTAWRLIRAMVLVLISLSGFAAYQFWCYRLYCSEGLRPWCSQCIPLIYNFVQSHYWRVGFLNYYRWSQLPNFAIASPATLFSLWAIYEYGRVDWVRLVTCGLIHRQHSSNRTPFHSRALLPHIYLWAFLLGWTLLVAHVQIVNRLLTCIPALYWAMAHWWVNAAHKNCFLAVVVGWAIVNTVLFLNFYPPA